MESKTPSARSNDALDSRRARREAAGTQLRTPRSRSHHATRATTSHRWLGRTGILTSLAIVTIAMPLAAGAGKADTGTDEPAVAQTSQVTQSTLQVLTEQRRPEPAPVIVADTGLVTERDLAMASRSGNRADEIPQCATGTVTSSNGLLGTQERCDLDWAPGHSQQPEAALALDELNAAYRARFGQDICLTSSYRTLSSQQQLAVTKPGLAATPGQSMHGWGLAIDICSESYSSTAQWNWLKTNAPIFGYDNPAWARRGGGGAYEPWHWEYFPLVETM